MVKEVIGAYNKYRVLRIISKNRNRCKNDVNRQPLHVPFRLFGASSSSHPGWPSLSRMTLSPTPRETILIEGDRPTHDEMSSNANVMLKFVGWTFLTCEWSTSEISQTSNLIVLADNGCDERNLYKRRCLARNVWTLLWLRMMTYWVVSPMPGLHHRS